MASLSCTASHNGHCGGQMEALEAWATQGRVGYNPKEVRTPPQRPLGRKDHWAPSAICQRHPLPACGPRGQCSPGVLGPPWRHRFRTLRIHCLCFESIQKLGFNTIPWKESDIRSLLNTLTVSKVSRQKGRPSKKAWWRPTSSLSAKPSCLPRK